VHARAVDVGSVEQVLVGGRVVRLDALDQLVLPQEPARLRRQGFGGVAAVRLRDGLGGRLGWMGLGDVQAQ